MKVHGTGARAAAANPIKSELLLRIRKCTLFLLFSGEYCASLLEYLAQFLGSSWYGFQLQPDPALQEQP